MILPAFAESLTQHTPIPKAAIYDRVAIRLRSNLATRVPNCPTSENLIAGLIRREIARIAAWA